MRRALDILVPAVVIALLFLVVALWIPGLAAFAAVAMFGMVLVRLVRRGASDRA